MKKCVPKLDFLHGALVQLQTVLPAKIEMSFPTNIAAFRRAAPKLLKMQELAYKPPRSLPQALLDFPLRRGFWSNHPKRSVGKHRNRHRRAVRKLHSIIEGVRR